MITRNTRRNGMYLALNWPIGDIFAQAMSQRRTLNFIQRMAHAMTQHWPATQAGVGFSSANPAQWSRNVVQGAHGAKKPLSRRCFNPQLVRV